MKGVLVWVVDVVADVVAAVIGPELELSDVVLVEESVVVPDTRPPSNFRW